MNKLSKTLVCSLMLVTLAGCAKGNGLNSLSNSKLIKLAGGEDVITNKNVDVAVFTQDTTISFPFSNCPIVMYGQDVANALTSSIILSGVTNYGNLYSPDGLYYCGNSSNGFIFNKEGAQLFDLPYPLLSASMYINESFYLDWCKYAYATVNNGLTSFDLYYQVVDGTAKAVSSDEYQTAKSSQVKTSSFITFKSIGINSDNKYTFDDDGTMFIYTKKGKFVGSIPEFAIDNACILGKGAIVFSAGYSIKALSDGRDAYNSYSYTIDLDKATWKYEEDLPFIVEDSDTYYTDSGYSAGSLVTVTPLSKDKTSKMPYYEIRDAQTSLKSASKYAYDSIIGYNFSKLGKKAIAYQSNSVFYLSGNDRMVVEGIAQVLNANSEYVQYKTDSGKMGTATVSEFESGIKTGTFPECTYSSWNTYNSKRLEYNSEVGGYRTTDGALIDAQFISYASSYGMIVNGSKLYTLGGTNVLDFGSTITSVNYTSTFSSSQKIFQVIANGTTTYIRYNVA